MIRTGIIIAEARIVAEIGIWKRAEHNGAALGRVLQRCGEHVLCFSFVLISDMVAAF